MSSPPVLSCPPFDKASLRREMRNVRRQASRTLTPVRLSRSAYQLLRLLKRHKNIGVYLDAFSEVPTQKLIRLLLKHHKKIFVPQVRPACKTLHFTPFYLSDLSSGRRVRHRHGMMQFGRSTTSPGMLHAVVMPALAVDVYGTRLGMGGGYYDRTFKKYGQIRRIAYIYREQQRPFLPADPWDLKVHHTILV